MGQKLGKLPVLLHGLDASGKTTILYKLKLGETVTTIPTRLPNEEEIEYRKMTFVLKEVGYNPETLEQTRTSFQGCYALIFVIDSNDRERISAAKEELEAFRRDCDGMEQLPLLVFANKQDLRNAMSVSEMVVELELNRLKQQWYIQGACATTGDGLYEGLDWLTRELQKLHDSKDLVPSAGGVLGAADVLTKAAK
mmetsp:Transcript_54682/g.119030  ORF Transcript_54682/g.119030 Transcript_54682/m.119030 type:complete len:196 (-) Transcript_54682:252-839(-)